MNHHTPVAYAVAVWTGRRYIFFCGNIDDKQAISDYPCCAKLFAQEEDAKACADFLDSDNPWEVVPMYEKE